MRKRRVILLGSTGSIGASAINVALTMPGRMEIVGMAAHRSWQKLAEGANLLKPEALCLVDSSGLDELRARLTYKPIIFCGLEGLIELSTLAGADMVLVAIVGIAGLRPALAAIDCGKDLAIASKEILVMAGEIVMSHARNKNVAILPVDSEHNAIFQCLPPGFKPGERPLGVRRLLLTASGGPFLNWSTEALSRATPAQACAHPRWNMGRKISVDSATLMNKGLELIEASVLFGMEVEHIDVVVHPQSIVHSLVEYEDGSVLAQLSAPDMRTPIAQALASPARMPAGVEFLDLVRAGRLEFLAPDPERFPCLRHAREAARLGGLHCASLNAADEVAVQAFLDKRLNFGDIPAVIETVMARVQGGAMTGLDAVLAADGEARALASEIIARRSAGQSVRAQ
jgi:1-deoxy-D-xylulose-5-phosphate reductoisomerase